MNEYDIYLIGALDSLGVPYTIDNIESKSFIDIVADYYRNQRLLVNCVNLCSLAKNKTWELIEILKKDYLKSQYYKINQKFSKKVIDDTSKEGRFNHPVNPSFVNQYYNNIDYPDTKITTSFKMAHKPIFLYTCGGMNFDYYTKFPTRDIKQILPEFIFRLSKNLKQTMTDIEECLKFIINLNPNVEIYVLGVYPMVEQAYLRIFLQEFYKLYNNKIKEICNKFNNAKYIDIFNTQKFIAPKDNHPTYEGQKFISKQLIKVIEPNRK